MKILRLFMIAAIAIAFNTPAAYAKSMSGAQKSRATSSKAKNVSGTQKSKTTSSAAKSKRNSKR
ncbi:MAG: hypothetical protein HYS18_11315 [Burkholderiales bacterium]|nr:hypothetical protein [Burkholderiales bacterium]